MYNRSVNKLKYLSVAVNALKKIKNQSVAAAKGEKFGHPHYDLLGFLCFVFDLNVDADEGNRPQLRGNVPLSLKRCTGNCEMICFTE